MIHRKTFSYVFSATLAVTAAAVVATATSDSGWSPRIYRLVRGDVGPPELGGRAPWAGPLAARPRADLSAAAAGGTAPAPLLAGLPPAFATLGPASSAPPAASRSNGNANGHANDVLWGATPGRASGQGSSSSRAPGSLNFPGGGGGFNGSARNPVEVSATVAGDSAATSASPASPGNGGGASSGSGSSGAAASGGSGDAGLFAEQTVSIAALAEGSANVSVAALEATGAAGRSLSAMSSTPEPGSLLLIGTGLLGMFGALRRRLV